MIEDNVGHALDVVVSGHGDHGHGKVEVPGRVDGDQAIHRSLQEHARVFVDQIGAVAVAGDKVEVSLLQEVIFHSAHNGSRIPVAHFRDDDTDGKAALGA